jgi:hypothetical protein
MDDKSTRMIFATAALAAVAAVLAGPAGAYIQEGNGAQPVASQSDGRQSQSSGDVVVPYLSQGQGVDKAQFSGASATRKVAGQQASQQGLDVALKTAIAARAHEASQVGQQTIPYLSQGMGVDASQFGGKVTAQQTGVHAALLNRDEGTSAAKLPHGAEVVLSPSSDSQSLGLTGDSALTRASCPVSTALGLSGDSPLTRVSAPEPEGLTGDGALTRVPEKAPTATVSTGNDIDWTSFGAGAGMVALIAAGIVGILLTARRRHTVGLP